ncbi:MAG: hypothetical protein JXQ82_03855 [Methanomicrobiaceae archaeon]|nr:hypothetical protein [Methanomicrobiaceae archaeon]
MVKFNWEVKLSLTLVAMTVIIYSFKFFVLRNPGDTLNYIFNALGFLPINVLLVTIVLNKLLIIRSRREKFEKMNMVIGTFFTEIGNHLIKEISKGDSGIDDLKNSLVVKDDWDDDKFENVLKKLSAHVYSVDTSMINLYILNEFLSSRRDFMLRLLENPVLIEHESFTDLLRAVFHLTEELKCRGDFSCLPYTDHVHLSGDIGRVYERLIIQWLNYMKYLKNNYPYLFSLEMRTNPFDAAASPIVKQ